MIKKQGKQFIPNVQSFSLSGLFHDNSEDSGLHHIFASVCIRTVQSMHLYTDPDEILPFYKMKKNLIHFTPV
jgi:hypothetical protein